MDRKEAIEIPFGAKDSELKGWEYTIPEGMEAEIKDGKIIVREKESEDEQIRKRIIHFLHGDVLDIEETNKAISWLEKQGEQKPNPYSGTSFEYNGHTWGMCARDNGIEILIDGHIKGRVFADDTNAKEMFIKALERVEEQNAKGYKLTDCDKNSWWEDFKAYCSYSASNFANSAKTCKIEQKPTDKIEPKFKVGDWVANDYCAGKVIELTDDSYLLDTGQGIPFSCEHNAHLWTIDDAKNGDVLVASDGSIFLFKSAADGACKHYAALTTDNAVKFNEGLKHYWETSRAVHPATKEQCDQLENAMLDAGYEWDAEKKELKKLSQQEVTKTSDQDKNEWSEEDEKMLNDAIGAVWAADYYTYDDKQEIENWLKSLKTRLVGSEQDN